MRKSLTCGDDGNPNASAPASTSARTPPACSSPSATTARAARGRRRARASCAWSPGDDGAIPRRGGRRAGRGRGRARARTAAAATARATCASWRTAAIRGRAQPRRPLRRRARAPPASTSRSSPASEEARLAFAGALATLAEPRRAAPIGVIDVGGGSSELVVGTVDDGVTLVGVAAVGSGTLADAPPALRPAGARRARRRPRRRRRRLRGLDPPAAERRRSPSAAAPRRCAAASGGELAPGHARARARVLLAEPAAEVARGFELHPGARAPAAGWPAAARGGVGAVRPVPLRIALRRPARGGRPARLDGRS